MKELLPYLKELNSKWEVVEATNVKTSVLTITNTTNTISDWSNQYLVHPSYDYWGAIQQSIHID